MRRLKSGADVPKIREQSGQTNHYSSVLVYLGKPQLLRQNCTYELFSFSRPPHMPTKSNFQSTLDELKTLWGFWRSLAYNRPGRSYKWGRVRHLHPQRCSSERTWDAGVVDSVIQQFSVFVHLWSRNIQQLTDVSLHERVQYNGTWCQISRFIIEVGYETFLLKFSVAWNSQVFDCETKSTAPKLHSLCNACFCFACIVCLKVNVHHCLCTSISVPPCSHDVMHTVKSHVFI